MVEHWAGKTVVLRVEKLAGSMAGDWAALSEHESVASWVDKLVALMVALKVVWRALPTADMWVAWTAVLMAV